jgi:hypothetical protein
MNGAIFFLTVDWCLNILQTILSDCGRALQRWLPEQALPDSILSYLKQDPNCPVQIIFV